MIWLVLVAIVLGCFFSACNIALRTYSRARLSEMLEDRDREYRFPLLLERTRSLLMMTAIFRVVLNLVLLLALLNWLGHQNPEATPYMLSIEALIVAGILITIFGVTIPQTWAHYAPEKLLCVVIPLLFVLHTVCRPAIKVLQIVDPVIRRLAGVDDERDNKTEDLKDEVISAVEEHDEDGAVDAEQKDMLEAVIELPSTSADQIMTPRTDVRGIEVAADLETVKDAIIRDGHSRIPVYEDNLDHIVGILYAKDLIRFLGNSPTFELRNQVRPAMMVPQTKPVRELLEEFKLRKVHIAIVLDEYGGTAGLVTIEDIIEEIIGDIEDEYEPIDKEKPEIRTIDPRTAEADARVYIDTLNDELDIELPENDDYETLGGFVLAQLGHVPEAGESFEYDALRFVVTQAEPNRVSAVRIESLEDDLGDQSDSSQNNDGKNGHKNGHKNGNGRNNGNGSKR